MSDDRVTSPVTGDLLRELINTEAMLDQYMNHDARLNDKDHYGAAVLQLEALATAILAAQSRGSLLVPNTSGARFHTHSGSPVTKTLDDVVPYLSNVASKLLGNDGSDLSKFQKDHTLEAYDHLHTLRARILNDIRHIAAADVALTMTRGAATLAFVANTVAGIAVHGVPAQADDIDRCDIEFTDGGRCSKPAGHRPPGSHDEHTP